MAPEFVGTKGISLKDSLGKAFLGKHPNIELFAECIDRHPELSLKEKEQWLTFVTSTYEPPGSIKKSIITNGDVAVILGIPKIKVEQHLEALGNFRNFDNLWKTLEREINKEAKKKPDLFKSSHTKQPPVSQETVSRVKRLIGTNTTDAKIAQDLGLPVGRIHYLGRKLLKNGETKTRSRKKSSPTARS